MENFVVICSVGRSGSTTIQRIINTIPNTNITGENNGAIINLLEFYFNLKNKHIKNHEKKNYAYFVENKVKPCWYNSFNFEEVTNNLRTLIKSLFFIDGSTTIGFKEIRFNGKNINLIYELRELFPSLKVIIHIREDVEKQSVSDWWKNNTESREIITKLNNIFCDFYTKNSDFCYLSTFDNMFKLDKLKELFVFINKRDFFDEKQIKNILENNIRD
jgi:hypothetical protein